MTIRHLTLSIQDDEGKPIHSLGAKLFVESENGIVLVSDDADKSCGVGSTEVEAITKWIYFRLSIP